MPPKIQLIDPANNIMEVDATASALRVLLYGANGLALPVPELSQVASTDTGLLIAGRDDSTVKTYKANASNNVQSSDETVFLFDNCEGTTINTVKWVSTATTMAATQAAATGILLNSASTTTTTTGIQQVTHRAFPILPGSDLIGRFCVRATAHSAGNVIEIGFGDPTVATTQSVVNGAYIRKGMGGEWYPVVSTQSFDMVGDLFATSAEWAAAIPATEYFFVSIEVRRALARFKIFNKTEALIYSKDIAFGSVAANAGQPGFSTTQLKAYFKTYNVAAVTTAVQLFLKEASVTAVTSASQRPWPLARAGMGDTGLMNPVAVAQTANYTNNTTATARTLSNTAAGETTLGGTLIANAMATGAPTDLIMFGWQNPSAIRTFFVESIYIPAPLNQVAAITTTDTIFQYFAAWNSSAVSLATAGAYPPIFYSLQGIHRGIVTSAANTLFTGEAIVKIFDTPVPVFPSRFFHLGCRCLLGTATATETFLWAGVLVSGFYE